MTPAGWASGPTRPLLPLEEIHVWIAELDQVPDRYSDGLLSREERDRRERIVVAERARWWGRSRAILRELAGRYLDQDPASLRFTAAAHGKPAIAGHGKRLRFSVSHCGTLALYAFARDCEVGVDVQTHVRDGLIPALARRTFAPDVSRRLQDLEPRERRAAFLCEWARYEASVKWHGGGLAAAHSPAADPWVIALPVGSGCAAALAAARPARTVRCWSWSREGAETLEDPDGDRLGEGFTFDHNGQQHVGAVVAS